MKRSVGVNTMIVVLGLVLALWGTALAADEVKIDLNQAGIEELKTLDGVGEALAGRIVAYRDQSGPFATIDDLMKVKGIGEKVFAANRHRITVSTPAKN